MQQNEKLSVFMPMRQMTINADLDARVKMVLQSGYPSVETNHTGGRCCPKHCRKEQ